MGMGGMGVGGGWKERAGDGRMISELEPMV
jgi:hypothetical protein